MAWRLTLHLAEPLCVLLCICRTYSPRMAHAAPLKSKASLLNPALDYKYHSALHSQLDFLAGFRAEHFFVQLTERGKHVASAAGATERISPFCVWLKHTVVLLTPTLCLVLRIFN